MVGEQSGCHWREQPEFLIGSSEMPRVYLDESMGIHHTHLANMHVCDENGLTWHDQGFPWIMPSVDYAVQDP